MVRDGDSRSEGLEFESQHRILDGIFYIDLLYNFKCLFEKYLKYDEKRPGMAHF